MSGRGWIAPILIVALAAVLGVRADDESPYAGAERFTGTYLYVGTAAEQQARLDAIENVVQQMNRVLHRTARRRISEGTHVTSSYVIAVDGDQVSMTIDDGRCWVTPMDGTPIEYTHDGDVMFMSRRWIAGTIFAQGDQKAGTGTYHFRLSEDGQTLHVAFTLDSKHMPEAVAFDTTYRRIK